jgi:catechol 2,3-dioxygenase-like lactoylglutathione lyase family enzyme
MRKSPRVRRKPATHLDFNHAMVYSRDLGPSIRFYRDHLEFRVIEEMSNEGRLVYARLMAPTGRGTLALHRLEANKRIPRGEGVRLYFEVRDLEPLCRRLKRLGVRFSQLPKMMPWGWKHAYLDDPDGHEVSLYWAGPKRYRKSSMAG